jgi:hypothetical protein
MILHSRIKGMCGVTLFEGRIKHPIFPNKKGLPQLYQF